MGCVGKTVVRGVVITALAGGVLVAVAGPHRVHALIHQTRDGVNQALDSMIDDPVALRQQIRELEAEYPEKIAEVRGDLSEVQTQIAQLSREKQVATKVVQLAQLDLDSFDAQLTRARDTQSNNPGAIVRVAFDSGSRPLELDDAYARREQIGQTRDLYAGRVQDLTTDLGYLNDQESQLSELLTKLETEQAEFQSKLYQLDAQIDSISRNERLIGMMEDRQATIDEHSRFKAHSVEQLNGRLTQIRNEQRARLESISRKEKGRDYVNEAEFLVNQEGRVTPTQPDAGPVSFTVEPRVIDVAPNQPALPASRGTSTQ